MVSARHMNHATALLFGLLLVGGFGCQAVHEDVITYDRPDVDMSEDEQVSRLLESGGSFLKSEIYPEAEKRYREVLRIDPGNRTANINLSYVLRKQDRPDEAFQIDQRFAQRFPDDADGYARLAAAYAGDKGDLEAAAKQMEKAIALSPDEKTYHTDLGYYYNELEMYDEATVAYEDAHRLDPDDETVEKVLMGLYERTGDVAALADSKKAALAEDPENPALINDLAKIYRGQEDWAEAAVYYDKLAQVTEADSTRASVLKNLAVCQIQVPDTAAAIRTYKKVIDIGADTDTYVRLAELQSSPNIKQFDDAIRTVQVALSRNESNARGWCVWGKALENLKQYEQAKTKYDKAVALNDPVWSPYAEKELVRQNQLIERAKKLAEKAKYESTEYGD